MKKYISLLLAGALAVTVISCGTQPPQAEVYEVGQVQALVDGGVFSEELETLDAEMAFALYHMADYGLTLEDLQDAALVRSSGATCEEGAVMVLADAEKAELALKAVEDYIQSQIDSNVDYRPDEIPKLEEALVSWKGHTLVFVVGSDMEKAKELLKIE